MTRAPYVAEFWRLVRFSIVGGIAAMLYVIGAMVAISIWHVSPIAGTVIGFVPSISVSYIGHFHFTFVAPGRYRDYVLKFAISSAASFILSTAVIWLGTDVFKFDYRAALAAVVVLIPGCSYLVNRFWVFFHPSRDETSDRPLRTV